MLDILVALIEELLGTKKAPPPRPRRQVRQADQRSDAESAQPQQQQRQSWYDTSTTPVGGHNPEQFDQMVKQFFGMRDEEEAIPEDTPQPVVEAREPARKVAAQAVPEMTGTLSISHPVPAPAVQPLAGEPQRRLGEETSLREIVHDLRNNPDAAREAFLYAEIFGPPLADR